ncbi:MAG TPA: hypothetical protein VFQ26_04805, partial [Nitrospiraceae bacterium]|nr:hypothetical protein [Nitrospiraceae bacterium]
MRTIAATGRAPGWTELLMVVAAVFGALVGTPRVLAAQLRAGAAKVDITHPDTETRNERLYVRALVLSNDDTMAVVIA